MVLGLGWWFSIASLDPLSCMWHLGYSTTQIHLPSCHVLYSEVEPHSVAGVACIWSDEEVILKVTDVVHATKVT